MKTATLFLGGLEVLERGMGDTFWRNDASQWTHNTAPDHRALAYRQFLTNAQSAPERVFS
jgi:hypothetical protein